MSLLTASEAPSFFDAFGTFFWGQLFDFDSGCSTPWGRRLLGLVVEAEIASFAFFFLETFSGAAYSSGQLNPVIHVVWKYGQAVQNFFI